MKPQKLLELTDIELDDIILSTENHISALEYELGKMETEKFYRANPECRPKNLISTSTKQN